MISVKRGDTLAFLVRRKNEDGTPRTGEASQLKSQIRSKETLIGEFTITETVVPGEYLFEIKAVDTLDWAVGSYVCDIQFTEGDFVQSSDTFKITVEKDVTRDAG
jgi:hypothetical protein